MMKREIMRKLPETCYSVLPSTGALIVLRCGEKGYYESLADTNDREKNQKIADKENASLGVTYEQVRAMEVGSMFGWDVPGCDPDIWVRKESTDHKHE